MKIVNPAWKKAVRVELAAREMTKNQLFEMSALKSREYMSAVVNGRAQSDSYASKISAVLGIQVPYTVEMDEANIC